MKLPRPLRILLLAAAMTGAFALPSAFADEPDQPAAAPEKAAQKQEKQPEAPKAKVTADAQKVIDQVDAAYGKLKTLELAGTFSGDIQAAGEQRKESKKFTASFAAPNKFRHAMEEDILIGSTGQKAYAYLQDRNLYTQAEAPKEKAPELDSLPEPIPQVMQMQNPSLMLALVKSASGQLGTTFSDIQKGDDVKLDGAAFQSLKLTLPNQIVVTMLFHPDTHLLRQARADIKAVLEQRGTPDVKQAVLTVDYTTVKPDAAVKDEQFAWAPPQAARDMAEMAQAQAGAAGGPAGAGADRPSSELEGKAAPDFALKDLEGKTVALKDLKGKVLVLDMWATWCPPCRASLPHLDKLHEALKDKGVNVYAMNVQEDKADVEQFIKNTGLKTPVILDSDGAVSQKYKVTGIPQTVIIGKDGKVAKVFIGFGGEESAKEMRAAVEEAMKAPEPAASAN
jgi:peroxiredoxin/outer membrane lipoprotein-sorting protein